MKHVWFPPNPFDRVTQLMPEMREVEATDVAQLASVSEGLILQAYHEVQSAGLGALDALHVAAANISGAEEFVTEVHAKISPSTAATSIASAVPHRMIIAASACEHRYRVFLASRLRENDGLTIVLAGKDLPSPQRHTRIQRANPLYCGAPVNPSHTSCVPAAPHRAHAKERLCTS